VGTQSGGGRGVTLKHIAQARAVDDAGVVGAIPKFPAQAADGCSQGVGRAGVGSPPDLPGQFVAGDGAPPPLQEQAQQPALGRRQIHAASADNKPLVGLIEEEPFAGLPSPRAAERILSDAAKHGLHIGEQDRRGRGVGQVTIGAKPQGLDGMDIAHAGAQDQQREINHMSPAFERLPAGVVRVAEVIEGDIHLAAGEAPGDGRLLAQEPFVPGVAQGCHEGFVCRPAVNDQEYAHG